MRTRRLTLSIAMSIAILSAAIPAAGQGGEGAAKPAVARPWPPARLADGQPTQGETEQPKNDIPVINIGRLHFGNNRTHN